MNALKISFLALLILPACGNDDDGPRGRTDPLTVTAGLCQAWGEAACNQDVTENCAAASMGDCVAAQAEHCAGMVGEGPFLATDAKACVAAVEAAFADAKLDYEEWLNVVRGAEGACADLNPPPDGTGGTGSGGEPLVGGADCDPVTDTCVETHYCDNSRGFAYCRPRAEVGQYCCENDPALVVPLCSPVPCVASGFCDGPTGSQTCTSLGGVAAECVTDAECGPGLICVDAVGGKICTAVVVLGTGTPVCESLR